MAKPKRTHTIESLLLRTHEYGECNLWDGYCAHKTPQVHFQGKMAGVRRVMHFLKTGIPFNKTMYFSSSCGEHLCVNPQHIVCQDTTAHMARMSSLVDPRSVNRRMKLVAAAKARGLSKLTNEQVMQIFNDNRSGPAVAKDFNICKAMVSKIRRGHHAALNLSNNNVFAGLMK